MAYRDVLLPLIGYSDPTPDTAIEQAVDMAGVFGARITALTFEI